MGGWMFLVLVLLAVAAFVAVRRRNRQLAAERAVRELEPVKKMAFDVDRDDWRTFRMDRMTSVEPTTWRFPEREHEDPATYVQRAVASGAYRFQARIVVHAPLQEVAERTGARSVVLSAVDDETTLLEAGAETLYGLAFHLSFLGWEFEVEEPAELRTALAEMGGRALRAAGAS